MVPHIFFIGVSISTVFVLGCGNITAGEKHPVVQLSKNADFLVTNNEATINSTVTESVNVQKRNIAMSENKNDIDPPIMAASLEFKTQTQDRSAAAKILLPFLATGTPLQKIEIMLGKPTAVNWDYMLFYSSTLVVSFNGLGKVDKIFSDLLDEVKIDDTSTQNMKSENIIEAISKFKAQPYNRQAPAKKLLPLIKVGMTAKEIEDMLGKSDGKVWVFNLLRAMPSFLYVRLSSEDKIEAEGVRLNIN